MIKLAVLYALGLAASHVLGAPHPLDRRDTLPDPHYKWPYYCNDSNFRDATLLRHANNALVNSVRGYAELNYKSPNSQGEPISVPKWISRQAPKQYGWSCDSTGCDLGDFNSTCMSGGGSGPMGVTLEQIKNLYAYLKSVQGALSNQRDFLLGHMGVLFGDFGGQLSDGEPWDKKIGAVTAGVGALAAVVPKGGGAPGAVAAGIGFAAAIAGFLIPEEEKEKNFKWAAAKSAEFSDNIQLIQKTIDTWIDLNLMKPIDDIKYYVNMDGNLFTMVEEGRFAVDPEPPLLPSTDNNVLVGLSAPFINQIWKDQGITVVVFKGQAWRDAGFDLCGNNDLKFYEELQSDRRICDGEGNLHILMRYGGMEDGDKSYPDIVRKVVGLDKMGNYGASRDQVIDGSIANHLEGGYEYGLSPEVAVERLKTMKNVDQLAMGKVNVWNLPTCFNVEPDQNSEHKGEDLEYWMAVSMLWTCSGQSDQNGKGWPYGDICDPGNMDCK